MKLQEAISKSVKTGKSLKRKQWNYWMKVKYEYFHWEESPFKNDVVVFTIDDITADDWEVKEEHK